MQQTSFYFPSECSCPVGLLTWFGTELLVLTALQHSTGLFRLPPQVLGPNARPLWQSNSGAAKLQSGLTSDLLCLITAWGIQQATCCADGPMKQTANCSWGRDNKELTGSPNSLLSKTVLYGGLPRSTQQQLLMIINVWQIRESP